MESMSKRRKSVLTEDSENDEDDSTNSNLKEQSVRRGRRQRKPTMKLAKAMAVDDSDESESSESEIEIREKPSEVLLENEEVIGKKMFGFKTPQKRGGMAQKATQAINSPHFSNLLKNKTYSQISPKKSVNMPPKTPHALRTRMRKELANLAHNSSSEDFSASEDEYQPNDQSGSEESEGENEEESDEKEDKESDDSDDLPVKNKIIRPKVNSRFSTNSRSQRVVDEAYVPKPDHYFSWQANSKIITSNHTLQKLKTPKLSEDQLQNLLSSCSNQSSVHENSVRELFKTNLSNLNKWMCMLNEGFSILLYGLGSKRNILKTFQEEMLSEFPVVVVNGYFPSLTIKDVTDGILLNILEEITTPTNVYEAIELIEYKFSEIPNTHLYVIVHNIDGPMLRNNKSQNVLASLAAVKNIHVIASIDHINTPLIWDHSKLSKFNFIWWDVTSFLQYSDETSFESSMLVQRSGALALSSLASVYQSLTKNSKGVFMLVVKYQIANKAIKHYQGMPFKVLYSQCRENFLVSSDLALRAQLTEFLDHKLVKSRRSADGTEQLVIPVHNSLLQQFLDQQS